jgi:hypothetical protein
MVTIEVDRPLPERAGGFIILPKSYVNLFGDAGQLCCCLDICSGRSGLGGSRSNSTSDPETKTLFAAIACECGKIGQITWPKKAALLLVRFPSAYEI